MYKERQENMIHKLKPTKRQETLINEGIAAYEAGKSIIQNPYDDERDADWWSVGWFVGKAKCVKKGVFA
jgi:hypothetical protein